MWPATESRAKHKDQPHSALRLCTRQVLREQTVPVPLCWKGREERSGFHDHRQLHGHFSKGCYLHLHLLCTHFPVSGDANQYLHSGSSNKCVSGWWGAEMPFAVSIWVIYVYEACGVFDTGGSGVSGILHALFQWEALIPSLFGLFVLYFLVWIFLRLSWSKVHRRWQ